MLTAAGAGAEARGRRLPRVDDWGALLVIAPACVAALRQVGEVILGVAWPHWPVFQNFLVFYLVTELVVLALLRATTGRAIDELAGPVALGLGVGVLPPLLDGLLLRGLRAPYVYFSGFRWLFSSPEQPPGETVAVWLGLLAVGGLAGWVTRRALPALLTWVATYVAMQVVGGGVPGLVQALFPDRGGPRLILHHLLMLALAVVCLALLRGRALCDRWRRLSHALPFAAVCALGARLAGDGWALAGLKAAVVLLASALVIAANDWFDRHQDGAGRAARSMERGDVWVLGSLQLLLCGSVAWYLREATLGLVLFGTLTFAYHHPATRLKRWLGAGYAVEAAAALACLLVGALRPSPPFLAAGWPLRLALCAVPAGFLLCSPLKDYKDIEDDRRAGVQTIYTALARRGIEPRSTTRALAALLVLCLGCGAALLRAAGTALPATLALVLLAVAAGAALLSRTPRAAVERAIWGVSVFLLVAALAAPPGAGGAARPPGGAPAAAEPVGAR